MAKLVPEPVQVRIKGIRLAKLMDSTFVGLLEKELPNVKYSHLSLYIPRDSEGKKYESILIGHYEKDHEQKQIFTVDCDEPETLKKLLRVLERIVEG